MIQLMRLNYPHLRPGPATNAPCFIDKPIESYIGIEPNTYGQNRILFLLD